MSGHVPSRLKQQVARGHDAGLDAITAAAGSALGHYPLTLVLFVVGKHHAFQGNRLGRTMARRTAVTELQQQIEEVRREAFAAGYAAAMQAVRELASHAVSNARGSKSRRRGAAGRKASITPRTTATPTRRRRVRASDGAASGPRRSAPRRLPRGANAQRIEEILKASAPGGLRAAEIRKALQQKGVDLPFTSIRHALGQLESRNAAEQVGDSKTWRHRGGAS